ncbi:MAG: hypothetical protein DHS20C17_18560 [Cyclobacteriaceae bacterium]|nr:MAG: hypothetical protein DHS20C17_18560 [Cyclobacteriaceae bacterium]
MLACSTVTEEKTIDNSGAMKGELLIQDGAWCWFSDPRAVYHRGTKEQIYFGYINGSGDVCIGSKDLESEQLNQFVLHDTLEVDDHNVPSILVLPNGKLLAFYNEHNGNVYLRKSANSEDISSWEGSRIVARETEHYNYCYSNPVQLKEENGRIYLIGRKVGPTRSFDNWWQYMKYSDDEGQTWSDDIVLLDNEGRKNPPYLKVATDHQSRIDFLFTDGHPKIGSDVSVYHMYYDEGVFFQTNGDTLAGMDQLPIPIASVNKLYDASETNIRAWIWDIALISGHPVITYSRYPTEDDHIYHYAYWQNGEWVDREVVNSGSWIASLRQGDVVREAHYSGGIVLDQQDQRHIYLAREISGKFEIEHRQLLPDSQWTTSLITARSTANNVRPYVVYNTPPEYALLLWMSGVYRHYTEYETDIKIAKVIY